MFFFVWDETEKWVFDAQWLPALHKEFRKSTRCYACSTRLKIYRWMDECAETTVFVCPLRCIATQNVQSALVFHSFLFFRYRCSSCTIYNLKNRSHFRQRNCSNFPLTWSVANFCWWLLWVCSVPHPCFFFFLLPMSVSNFIFRPSTAPHEHTICFYLLSSQFYKK